MPSKRHLALLLQSALLVLALFDYGTAFGQSAEERARIGRLLSAQTPCPAQPATDAERMACSQRAMAREISRQEGYCWSMPDQTGQSLAYRCDPRRQK